MRLIGTGRGVLVAVAAVVVLGAAVLGWARWRGPVVDAFAVQAAPLVRTVQVSARVEALTRVDVGATVTGRVAEVLVREGDAVRAGQPLLRLETDELRATLAQARASELQAQARLSGLRTTGRAQAQAALAQADAGVVAARAEMERAQALVAQGFVSGSRLDEARRALQVAEAQQANARAQVAANRDGGTDEVQAQAQWQAAKAATEAAQARLAQAELRAPTDGRVLTRDVEPGQIVQPGKALLALALAGPTVLVAQADERFLDQLATGQPATVVADAYAGQRFAARLSRIAPRVDAQRGAIEVKFEMTDAPPAFLREDMTLSVEVETARRDRALALPLAALRPGADEASATVLVAADGRAQARAVRLGVRTLQAVEVQDGLQDGELVLLGEASAQVQPGQRVRAKALTGWPSTSAQAAGGGGAAGAALTQSMGR
ncbi:efflux RND transporter periplasmic adaptor subunit [Hydrogenophaga sp.]|uniref:efflux RND transporter periplasmic adaptor subunit n=1 Tax=Hydrogenophaga sp. TaxID=1904254 RepID=UPI0035B0DDB9